MKIKHLVESTRPQVPFMKMMADFLPLAMKELGIDTLPHFEMLLHVEDLEQPTFGRFVNDENKIYFAIEDRHPLDVLRTLAHELVHYKQGTEHELDATSGETGSPIENEAHAIAGVIMRNFNKAHPEYFNKSAIDINKLSDQPVT